jgi:hypothetical protein
MLVGEEHELALQLRLVEHLTEARQPWFDIELQSKPLSEAMYSPLPNAEYPGSIRYLFAQLKAVVEDKGMHLALVKHGIAQARLHPDGGA